MGTLTLRPLALSITMTIRAGVGSRAGECWAEWEDVTPGRLTNVSAGKWCASEDRARAWLAREVAEHMLEG